MIKLFDIFIEYRIKDNVLNTSYKTNKTFEVATSKDIVINNIKELSEEKFEIEILSVSESPHEIIEFNKWLTINSNTPDNIYKENFYMHIKFATMISKLFKENKIFIINTHISRGIKLPVYHVETKNYTLIMQYGFYDYIVSVSTNKNEKINCKFPLKINGELIFNEFQSVFHTYAEGIPLEFIYPSYSKNNGKFTAELKNDYDLYVFLTSLNNYFDNQ